jgi:MFS family permease
MQSAIVRLAAADALFMASRNAAATAVLYQIYELTGSAVWVSVALSLMFGTIAVVSPWAGSLGDRVDRRALMLASLLATSVGYVALAAAGAAGSATAMALAAFAVAAVESPFVPAASASVPNLVGRDELSRANGTVGAAKSLGFMLGPGIGGVLIAVSGTTSVYAVSIAMTLVAAALLARLPGRLQAADGAHDHGDTSMVAGFRVIARDPFLTRLVIAWMFVIVGLGPVIVAELPLAEQFGVGSIGYGAIAVCWDGGAVLGALLARRLTARSEPRAVVTGPVVLFGGLLVVAATPVFWPVLLGMFVAGLADQWATVAEQNITQRRVADAVRARTNAAVEASVMAAMTLSFLVGGPLVEALGPQPVYAVAAVLAAVGAAVLVPLARAPEGRLPEPAAAQQPVASA